MKPGVGKVRAVLVGWLAECLRAVRHARRRVLFLAARWVMRRRGFDGARQIGAWLGVVHYHIDRHTRQRCLEGIAALMGCGPRDPQVERILREAYRVNSIAVLEVLSMVDRKLDAKRLRERCRVDGIANLEAALTGRGAILLATHSGNSLLLAAQLADAGLPVTVVYRRARMLTMEFFADGLPRYGIDGILANEGFRAYARMVDALRHNRVLFAMLDQGVATAETGVPLRFLGKDMPMPGGVVQLSRQMRTPILPVVSLDADPVWHFAIEPKITLQPGGSVAEDTAAILSRVEQQILAHPQLWSWHQRRWCEYPIATGA